jgi:hypothetical protein
MDFFKKNNSNNIIESFLKKTFVSMIENKTTEAKNTRGLTQHRIDIENNEMLNNWQSCCFSLDRRAVQYFTQTLIMIGVMSFCIAQLINLKSPTDQQTYLALLNFLLGVLLPTPKFK